MTSQSIARSLWSCGNLGINFGEERGNAMVYFETEPERFRFAQGKKGKFLRVQTGLRTFRSWPLFLTGLKSSKVLPNHALQS